MFICAFVLLLILSKKRRIADKRRIILLPCVPILGLLLYLTFYVLEAPWLRIVLGDMTAFFCLMYAATLEIFIKYGFLRANKEQALKKYEAYILEQDRLYNILQRDTAHQLGMMDDMIRRIEETESENEKKRLLYQMLVIGSYLKRRSNLAFLFEKSSMLDARELDLCIGESLSSLEACGIICGYRSAFDGQVFAVHIISMYEFFEKTAERLLDSECSMTVFAGREDEVVYLKIITDAELDLSQLAWHTAAVQRDIYGEQ